MVAAVKTSLQINRNQAIAHLEALGYKNGDTVYLRAIPGKGYEGEAVINLEAKFPNLPWRKLEELQCNKGIYFVVNGGGHKDADVEYGKALFCEFDDRPIEEQLLFWEDLKLPEPTLQITTRKSVHSYWIFDNPIPVEEWKSRQKDLLAFTNADSTLCNPSRVLRLAGCWHIKAGYAPIICDVVSIQSKKNDFEDLVQHIPQRTSAKNASDKPSHQYNDSGNIPLSQCLTKHDRALIDSGVGEGSRNSSGAKLARNLLGTAARLEFLGHRYFGDPRSLFGDYAARCSPPIDPKEADAIWRSALHDNPTATLTDDALENCVKAWQRNQMKATGKSFGGDDLQRTQSTALTQPPDPDERLRLELLRLLKEADPIKKIRLRAEICSNFRLSKSEVEQLLKIITKQTTQKETKVYTLDQLFALSSEGLQWLIPELLPKSETIILAGSPKAGKTLLAIDAAFAIATGESSFLGESVERGKVLLVSCDESLQSTRAKLLKRGFRERDRDYIKVLPQWSIDDLDLLEAQLEDFRPDVVIIDSLRRINHGSPVSENSAEFADNIYTLKETIGRYGASGILIHHTNKDKDAMGVGKLRGSSAIAGAVWGTWQIDHIPKPDENNSKKLTIDPSDPRRALTVFARDTEGQSLSIEFNPENNSWRRLDEEIQAEQLSTRERIIKILLKNSHIAGLSGKQIIELLGMTTDEGRGIYTELNRMVNKRLVSCQPAVCDKRVNLYSLLSTQQPNQQQGDSPPPIPSVPDVEYYAEAIDIDRVSDTQQITQQLLNNYSTTKDAESPVRYLEPSIRKGFGDTQQITQQQGGEGVPLDVDQSKHTYHNTQNTESRKEALATPTSPNPNDQESVMGNVELIRECIEEMNWEMIAALTEQWGEEFKKAVWALLSEEERAAVRALAPTESPTPSTDALKKGDVGEILDRKCKTEKIIPIFGMSIGSEVEILDGKCRGKVAKISSIDEGGYWLKEVKGTHLVRGCPYQAHQLRKRSAE